MKEDKLVSKLATIICGERATDACELMVSKLVATMQEACPRCMSDRGRLILNPMCNNRFYLSLLVEAGIPKTDYPADCYKIRLDEIQRILAGKPNPIPMKDVVVKLNDFLQVLFSVYKLDVSKKRVEGHDTDKIVDILSKIADEHEHVYFSRSHDKAYLLVKVKGKELIINLVDLARQIAYVDLKERHVFIDSINELVKLLFQAFGLKGSTQLTPTGNLYLEIELPSNIDMKTLSEILLGLDYSIITNGKNIARIRVVELGRSLIKYGELIEIFRGIAGAHK
ncbi:MAG: hypothetical protein NDP13_04260 [Crenarchaeota archaeon]|nr:hypothetical protein [Thermoproteota archaeon]MCR8455586.1 hypothetical protein [Thermoproteota archaeon]MCR8487877.1 hypothetical protein [Thermoproteota archaeon]MCR8501537.1 hypothetical protein [Thermoproteota archaeon]